MVNLKLALAKGRLEHNTVELLENAGLDCSSLNDPGRRLIHSIANFPLDIVLAKAPDVVTYVEHGVCDIGIVGKDTILERGRSFFEIRDLGFGNCRFALAAQRGFSLCNTKEDLRIATKYPVVAKAFLDSKHINAEIIKLEGSVELAPLLGLSDAIIDLVESGATLRENGLEVIEEIVPISARLIVNVAAMKVKRTAVERVIEIFTDGGSKNA